MPHWERKRWCEEISRINDDINDDGETNVPTDPRVDDVPVNDVEDLAGLFEEE
jgi:hypothetical protein